MNDCRLGYLWRPCLHHRKPPVRCLYPSFPPSYPYPATPARLHPYAVTIPPNSSPLTIAPTQSIRPTHPTPQSHPPRTDPLPPFLRAPAPVPPHHHPPSAPPSPPLPSPSPPSQPLRHQQRRRSERVARVRRTGRPAREAKAGC